MLPLELLFVQNLFEKIVWALDINLSHNFSVKCMAIRSMSYIMHYSCHSQGEDNWFYVLLSVLLGTVQMRMVLYEDLNVSFCKISCSKAVLKSCMGGSRKNMGETAKLLDIPKTLELFGINKIPYFKRELNKAVNIVIYLSCFVKVFHLCRVNYY
jgi:hypothetical protein